jgi:hypothetical protein
MKKEVCIDDKVSIETKNCMQQIFDCYIPEIVNLVGEYTTEMLMIETENCVKYGYYNEKNQFILHRENDEPAIIYKNGDKEWFCHGLFHRQLLPATIYIYRRPNGSYFQTEEYWENGVYIKTSWSRKG